VEAPDLEKCIEGLKVSDTNVKSNKRQASAEHGIAGFVAGFVGAASGLYGVLTVDAVDNRYRKGLDWLHPRICHTGPLNSFEMT
jgi:hypothetical protein